VGRSIADLWQRQLTAAMAGPTASPLYRDPVAAMTTRNAFTAAGLQNSLLEDSDADVVLRRLLEGTASGTRRTAELIFAESPALHRTQQIAAGVTGTSVEWRATNDGLRASIRPDREPGDLAAARITGASPADVGSLRPQRPRPPTLRAGAGLDLEQDTSSSASIAIQPGMQAWIETERLALDAARISIETAHVLDLRASTTWALAARTEVRNGWDVVVDARGDVTAPLPTRVSFGPQWDIPVRGPWALALTGTAEPRGWSEDPAWEVALSLRSRSRWRLADAMGQWPLGEKPGASIDSPMRVADRGANNIAPLVIPQVSRVLSEPMVVAGRPVDASCPAVP
jgi:hypothetical protein